MEIALIFIFNRMFYILKYWRLPIWQKIAFSTRRDFTMIIVICQNDVLKIAAASIHPVKLNPNSIAVNYQSEGTTQ